MSLDFTIFVSMIFFSGKRKSPPCLTNGKYYPHLLVKGDDEYLGVGVIDGSECTFDVETHVAILPLYDRLGYSKLKVNTTFFIMEGGKIVGEGIVNEIYLHQSIKEL